MLISKKGVEDFLERVMQSFDWIKKVPKKEIAEQVKELTDPVGFSFYTDPYKHQLECFFIGACTGQFIFNADMGLGKAQPVSEPVLTPSGWRSIGGLRVGDLVIGSDGLPTKVLGVFPQGIKRVFRLTLSDGTFVRAGRDHLWAVRTNVQKYRGQEFRVLTTAQLGESIHRGWQLPMFSPVEKERVSLPIDPYLLGVILGDGSISGSNRLLCTDTWIGEHIGWGCGVPHDRCDYVSTWSIPTHVLSALEGIGLRGLVSDTKFVPDIYMLASPAQRLALLQGLMDTDGYPGAVAEFCSTSPNLIDSVVSLVRSLGGVSHPPIVASSAFTYKGEQRQGKKAWRVTIKLPGHLGPFRLPRKSSKYVRPTKYPPERIIRSVVDEGVDERQVCIKVAANDSLYVTRDYVLTHNTKVILDLLRFFRSDGKVRRGLVICPSDTSADSWIAQAAEHVPDGDLVVGAATGTSAQKWEVVSDPGLDLVAISYPGLVAMSTVIVKKPKAKKGKRQVDKQILASMQALFDFVCLDEIHRCKNNTSLTFQVCDYLCKAATVRFGLTGTPMNKPEDFWAQFYLIDRGETLGSTLGIFRSAFFREVYSRWTYTGVDYVFDQKKKKVFTNVLKNRSIRYEQDECLDLPKAVFTKVPITMSKEARQYYKPNRDKLAEAVKNSNIKSIAKEQSFAVLREICSGFIMWRDEADAEKPDEKTERHVLRFQNNPKVEALVTLLADIPPTAKVVVFHEFVESGRMIGDALRKEGMDIVEARAEIKETRANIKRFTEDPKCKVLVVNVAVGGESLNLQAANYMVFYETPISPIMRKQCLARIRRAGQKAGHVFYYDLVTRKSVEEKIMESLESGINMFDALVNGKIDLP